jgi:DNA-binding PadR family transcriptional regulator
MENVVTLERWLKRGRQRSAVVRILKKPMTATEIHRAVWNINPHLQLRDLWRILPALEARGLVVCRPPRHRPGRLYGLSDLGWQVAQQAFGVVYIAQPTHVDWLRYSWVVRAKIRRLTLDKLAWLVERTGEAQCASNLRRFLRVDYPVGLNSVLRALKELAEKRLVFVELADDGSGRRCYNLTTAGRRIVHQLRR